MPERQLPPGQQLVAAGKWPVIGEQRPRADEAPWTIQVRHGDELLREFALAELQQWEAHEQLVDIHCVTRWSKLSVRFGGVRLTSLLQACGLADVGGFVSFVARSSRNHSTSLPLAETVQLNAMLALSADGRPLEESHGGPVRIVVPGRYFYKSLKWLERIEILEHDQLGFWESTAGYHNGADPWLEQRYIASKLSAAAARQILQHKTIAGLELRSLQAASLDLDGLGAAGALLRDVDFRNCRLAGADFRDANLSNAHFQRSFLQGADFRRADLEGADLSGANLEGADFTGASLFGATLFEPESGVGVKIDRQTTFDPGALEQLTPEQQNYLRHLLAVRPEGSTG